MSEQKISDAVMSGLTFAFVIFCFATMIFVFDSSEGVDGVSEELSGFSDDAISYQQGLETQLEDSSTSTGFTVKENIYIDERGQEEIDISGEETKSSFKKLFTKLKQSDSITGNKIINIKVIGFIISFIILALIILGLRAILGGRNGRV